MVAGESSGAAPPQQRSTAIDIVRLLGLLAVVANHLITGANVGGYVAVFFVISGYLWSDRRTFRDELSHRARILLVPYAAWLVILGSMVLIRMALEGDTPRAIAGKAASFVYGGEFLFTPLTAFWFMTAIFTSVMLFKAIRYLPIWAQCVIIAVAGLSTLWGETLAATPLAVGTGFCALVFVGAGKLFRFIEPRLRQPLLIGIVVVCLCVTSVLTGFTARMEIKVGDYGTPILSVVVAIAIACAALLISKAVAPFLPAVIALAITTVVRMSTPIILLHMVPSWLLPESTPDWVQFVLGLALPIAVGFLLLRVPKSWARRLLMPGK